MIQNKQACMGQSCTFLGGPLADLKAIFKDEQYIGYYTDKDPADPLAAADFAQAQYELAPVLLELNSLQHKYILFDCTTREAEDKKIAEMRFIPIMKNTLGPMTLVLNPRFPGQKQTD